MYKGEWTLIFEKKKPTWEITWLESEHKERELYNAHRGLLRL